MPQRLRIRILIRPVITTLIVDDHPAIRNGLMMSLKLEPGIVPIAAVPNSTAALELAAERRPRCALVDFQLGSEDGLDLVRRLRELERPPAVVLYSAFADTPLALAAKAAGASGVVSKGAPLEEVIQTLKNAGRGRGGIALPDAAVIAATAERLPADTQPVFELLLGGASLRDVAEQLRISTTEAAERVTSLFGVFHQLLWR